MIFRRWDASSETGARVFDLVLELAARAGWDGQRLLVFAQRFPIELVAKALNHTRLSRERGRAIRNPGALFVAVLERGVPRFEEGAVANVFECDADIDQSTTTRRET